MWDIKRLFDTENKLIGIISSLRHIEEKEAIAKDIEEFLKEGGGLIFISSKGNEEQCIKYYRSNWKYDVTNISNNKGVKVICKEDFYHDGRIDVEKLFDKVEKSLELMGKRGIIKKRIIMTFDLFWNSLDCSRLELIYSRLKSLTQEEGIGVIARYLAEDLSTKFINFMLDCHDFILMDRLDHYEYLTLNQFADKSLTLLVNSHLNDEKNEKRAIRARYLEALGELMEGTVHDINNLLVTILGYAQFSTMSDDIEEIKEYLRIIGKTASDGTNVINRIKSRMKGNIQALKDVYEFNYIINNCIEMVRHNFESYENRDLKLELDLRSNAYVYVNEYDIRHAIVNIILNGIEAMKDGGLLTVRSYDDRDSTVLEIIDTGMGMDEGTLNKIFNPYFTTKGSKGTGLGLSIARKTFDMHDGEIYVESKLGKGTEFTLYLPMVDMKDNIAYM